jgi:HD superfamily phosphodiesterase
MKHCAETFFEGKKCGEKMHVHCSCVIECCLGMAKDSDLDEQVFIVAGWIHDIAKKINDEQHHEISVIYLDEFLELHPEYNPKRREIADCIVHHRRAGKPETIYGMIFRAADKAAKHKLRCIRWKQENRT